MSHRILSIAGVLAILTACGGGTDEGTTDSSDTDTDTGDVTWTPMSYVDEGDVCFGTVDSDTDSTISVVVQDCMSSSCSREFAGSCSATIVDNQITLTSDIHWEDAIGDIDCTDDCGIPATSCTLEGLADGTYTVAFGTQTLTLTVPSVEDCDYY